MKTNPNPDKGKSLTIIELLLAILALPLAMAVLSAIVLIFYTPIAENRCSVRGYKNSDFIVHAPFFWNTELYCFDGEEKEGIKL